MNAPAANEIKHIWWDEATGYIFSDQGGAASIFAFDEYPDRPHECRTFDEAQAYVSSWEGGDKFDLHVFNSNEP